MGSIGDEEELEMDVESDRRMEMHTLNQLNSLLKPDRRAPKRPMPCGLGDATVSGAGGSGGGAGNHGGPDSIDFNMRLIREVRDRSYLYDVLAEAYNNPAWRLAAWNEVAMILECTPDQVKTRWKTLRDKFKKEDRKVGPGPASASGWAYYEAMEFLQPHLRDKSFGVPQQVQQQQQQLQHGQQQPMFGGGRSGSDASSGSCGKWLLHEAEGGEGMKEDSLDEKKLRLDDELSPGSILADTLESPETARGSSQQQQRLQEAAAAAAREDRAAAEEQSDYHRELVMSASSRHYTPQQQHQQQHQHHHSAAATTPQLQHHRHTSSSTRWNAQDEDEVFGHMIALRLAKMDPRFKEAVKVKLMQTLYEAQFGPDSPLSAAAPAANTQ